MSLDFLSKGFEELKGFGILLTSKCKRCDPDKGYKCLTCGKPAEWENKEGHFCSEHKPN